LHTTAAGLTGSYLAVHQATYRLLVLVSSTSLSGWGKGGVCSLVSGVR